MSPESVGGQLKRSSVAIGDRRMSYVEAGDGAPIVLLHGNPTSSYLWRNVLPHLEGCGRLIAPDLIGMGHSDKLRDHGPGVYRFVEHRGFLDQFLRSVGATEDVTFVLHDWGSALGFDWAHRHPEAVSGIVYMEAIVCPFVWDEWPERSAEMLRALRSPEGEAMVLDQNVMMEEVLPLLTLDPISEADLAVYRRPFQDRGESRRPVLTWPRELPIDGTPTDVTEIVSAYGTWLQTAEVPKLFINGEPGAILTGSAREYCRSWANQTEVAVPGRHLLPEDSADAIGRAIRMWLDERR